MYVGFSRRGVYPPGISPAWVFFRRGALAGRILKYGCCVPILRVLRARAFGHRMENLLAADGGGRAVKWAFL